CPGPGSYGRSKAAPGTDRRHHGGDRGRRGWSAARVELRGDRQPDRFPQRRDLPRLLPHHVGGARRPATPNLDTAQVPALGSCCHRAGGGMAGFEFVNVAWHWPSLAPAGAPWYQVWALVRGVDSRVLPVSGILVVNSNP